MLDLQSLIKEEFDRRSNIPNILNECLPYQLEFIVDPSLRKAVLGTRRSAKSFMIAIGLIHQALTIPKSSCIYTGLTNDSCEKIMWKDIFDVIFNKYQLDVEYLSSKHQLQFGNGSIIYLYGLDAAPKQKAKLRGQKYDLSVIDEIQDFEQDLNEILNGVLRMTLAQTRAPIWLSGTPCSTILTNHFWWQIWKPDSTLTEWKKFKFDWRNNTSIEPKTNERVCDAIQADVDNQIKNNPLVINSPAYKREVLGEWVVDSTTLVYKYNEILNTFNDLSIVWDRQGDNGWSSVLGVDFGYEDASALITLIHHRHNPNVYVLASEKHSHWTITEVANRIKELNSTYHYSTMVADAAAKQDIEEIKKHHHLPLLPSEKQGKLGYIQLLNADLQTGNIKIYPSKNQDLIKEMQELIWDNKKMQEGILKEKDSKDNHLTDAFLYAYRACRAYNAKPAPPPLIDFSNIKRPEDTFELLKRSGMLPQQQHTTNRPLRQPQDNASVIYNFKRGLY